MAVTSAVFLFMEIGTTLAIQCVVLVMAMVHALATRSVTARTVES